MSPRAASSGRSRSQPPPTRQAELDRPRREPAVGGVVRRGEQLARRPPRRAPSHRPRARRARARGCGPTPRRPRAPGARCRRAPAPPRRAAGSARARVARERRHRELGALEHADRADDRRRVDRRAGVLVVERDVARDDRRLEGLAGLGHAGDRLAQRVRRRRALGVAEVEAVRDRGGVGAAAGDVQHGLRDGLAAAAPRVERHARAVAVERHRDRAIGRREPHDGRVARRVARRCPSRRAGRTARTPRPWSRRSAARAAAAAAPRRRRARRSRRARAARRRASRAAAARARTWARRRARRPGRSPTARPRTGRRDDRRR